MTSVKGVNKAAIEGDLKTLRKLVNKGACINLTNDAGMTALHHAVYNNRENCVKYIIALKDVRLDIETYLGETPLFLACNSSLVSSSIVRILVDAGCDVNIARSDMSTPLHIAAKSNSIEKMQILLSCETTIIDVIDLDGDTPVHIAAYYDHDIIADMLLHAGADSNKPNELFSLTPLMQAADKNSINTMKVLLPFVDDINKVNTDNRSALMLTKHSEAINLLLKHKANPNLICKDYNIKFVALHCCISMGFSYNGFKTLFDITDHRVLEICNELDIINMLMKNITPYEENRLIDVFNCVKLVLESDLTHQCYSFCNGSIITLLKCVKNGSVSWDDFQTLLYLFLSKGVRVEITDYEEFFIIMSETIAVAKFEDILRILVIHGLDVNVNDWIFKNLFFIEHCVFKNKQCVLEAIHFDICYEPWVTVNSDVVTLFQCSVLDELVKTQEIFSEYLMKNSLKRLCRTAVRKNFRNGKAETSDKFLCALKSLCIPRSLKDFLQYKTY